VIWIFIISACAVAQWGLWAYDFFLACRARRGLAYWLPAHDENGGWVEDAFVAHRSVALTPQGHLVCELLVLAGLIPEKSVAPKRRKSR
jgi:hypothetical protein